MTEEKFNVGTGLGLITENMNLKANFDLFRYKLANFFIRAFNNPENMVFIVQDMEDPRRTLENKQMTKEPYGR